MKNVFLFLAIAFHYTFLNGQKISIDGAVTMLALGDSYTIGETVSIGERWPHQFIDELRALGVAAEYPDYIATTGWTTGNLLQGIQSRLDEEKDYNLVSILIGVNNQYQRIDISSYEPDLRKIMDRALEISGQYTSSVFVLSIPDYAYTPFGAGRKNISEQIDAYNSIKKRVAAEYQIAFIDITPISRLGLSDPSLVSTDGLHPSGNQYSEWVNEILPRLDLHLISDNNEKSFVETNHVRIYPNPTNNLLIIETELPDTYSIDIISLNRQLIHSVEFDGFSNQIDLSHFQKGVYFTTFRSKDFVTTRKIVKL